MVVHLQYGRVVIIGATVIRRGKHGNQLAVCVELVAICHHLMRSANQIQIKLSAELIDYLRAERVAHASLIVLPPLLYGVLPEEEGFFVGGITPEEIAEEALVRHIYWPHYSLINKA